MNCLSDAALPEAGMRTRLLPQSEAASRKAKLLPALPEAGAAKELGYYSQLGLMPPQGSLRALSLSRLGTVSGLLTDALAEFGAPAFIACSLGDQIAVAELYR